jgi:hypothetical protein
MPTEEVAALLRGQDLGKWQAGIAEELKPIRIATKGGVEASEMLQKGRVETGAEIKSREDHFRNVPVCGFGAAVHAWLVFGRLPRSQYWIRGESVPDFLSQVMAHLEGKQLTGFEKSQDVSRWFRDVLESNHFGRLAIRAAFLRVRDGRSWLKVFPRIDDSGAVDSAGIAVMSTEEVFPIWHPRDPEALVGVVEARSSSEVLDADGKRLTRWRLWTSDEWRMISANGELLSEGDAHDFGRPPFAPMGDGETMLRDAVLTSAVRRSRQWETARRCCATPCSIRKSSIIASRSGS